MTSKLTNKQELYVQGLVSGLSQRKAYINAGYSTRGKTDDYIDQQASRLFANSKVMARYNELMDEHKQRALWTREDAINTLKWLLDKSVSSIEVVDEGYVRKSTADSIIGSIQELNKLENLYDHNRDLTRKKQELEIGRLKSQINADEDEAETLDDGFIEALNGEAADLWE